MACTIKMPLLATRTREMNDTGSVSKLLLDLKNGDHDAAQALWNRTVERIAAGDAETPDGSWACAVSTRMMWRSMYLPACALALARALSAAGRS